MTAAEEDSVRMDDGVIGREEPIFPYGGRGRIYGRFSDKRYAGEDC
jgi:hypothetical protein